MSGGGGGTNTISEKQDPWAAQQPYLKDLYARGQEALNATPRTPYKGETLAPQNWNQEHGLAMGKDVATGWIPKGNAELQTIIDGAPKFDFQNGGAQGWGGNQFWSEAPAQSNLNTYLPALQDAATRGYEEKFLREVAPALSSQAISQGAYGGGRAQLGMGVAAGETAKAALDARSNLAFQAFETDANRTQAAEQARLGRMFQNQESNIGRDYGAWGLAQDQNFQGNMAEFDANRQSELARMTMLPGLVQQQIQQAGQAAEIFTGIGDVQQGWSQAKLDDAYNRYLESVSAPWNGLSQYNSIIAGALPGGSSSSTSKAAKQSVASGAIKGALGGAAMGGSAALALGASGPWGLAIGAGLGALGGALS